MRKRIRFHIMPILILTIILATPLVASALSSVVTRITNNSYIDYYPEVDGNNVVWYGWDGTDYEIFLYDTTTTQITNNSVTDQTPQVNGNNIVWCGWDGTDYEVFLYDIAAGTTTQLTNNSYPDYYPEVDGDKVVWYGSDGFDDEIFIYDIVSGTTTQITNNVDRDQRPQVNGSKVVWRSRDSLTSKVFMYDYVTGITTQISANAKHYTYPQIDGDRVVWEGSTGSNIDIFLYTLSTSSTTQITSAGYNYFPQISGDRVVYNGLDASDLEVFLYDISSGITSQLTSNTVYDWYPAISGDNIVWADDKGATRDVFAYKVSSGETDQVTTGGFSFTPKIAGDKVVWMQRVGSSWEIMHALINNTMAGSGSASVTVDIGNVGLIFNDITSDGYTTAVETTTSVPGPPSGFKLKGYIIDISTTAGYTAPIIVSFTYDDAQIKGNENKIKLFHHNGSSWDDITISLDTVNNIIVGQTDSLSPFALGVPDGSDGIKAEIEVKPEVIKKSNKSSHGKHIKVKIKLPSGYDIDDIDIGTIFLNETVKAEYRSKATKHDHDKDENEKKDKDDHDDRHKDDDSELKVKFSRADVINLIGEGDSFELTITGALIDGTSFTGSDEIKVRHKKESHKKRHKRESH